MSGNIEMKYEARKLENYIMDMLTMETCKGFLPVTFVKTKDEVIASYRVEGYRRLSSLSEMGTEDILNIILSLLESVSDAEKHYIFPDEYEITTNSVFVTIDYSKVRMLFLPAQEDIPLKVKIVSLMEKLADLSPEEGRGYIADAAGFIGQGDYGYKAVTHHLETLRKEVYLCGIR